MAASKPVSPPPDSAMFVSPTQWAARLQVSKRQLFRWISEGVIPPYDFAVGKTRRWHVSTFEAWVEKHMERN